MKAKYKILLMFFGVIIVLLSLSCKKKAIDSGFKANIVPSSDMYVPATDSANGLIWDTSIVTLKAWKDGYRIYYDSSLGFKFSYLTDYCNDIIDDKVINWTIYSSDIFIARFEYPDFYKVKIGESESERGEIYFDSCLVFGYNYINGDDTCFYEAIKVFVTSQPFDKIAEFEGYKKGSSDPEIYKNPNSWYLSAFTIADYLNGKHWKGLRVQSTHSAYSEYLKGYCQIFYKKAFLVCECSNGKNLVFTFRDDPGNDDKESLYARISEREFYHMVASVQLNLH